MAIPLTINGAVFQYPEDFDEAWGVDATGWAQAVTNGMLQMAGGSFPLTADINFGPNFGLLAKYFETRSANPATTGTVRLSSADAGVVFRNNANTGNLVLTTNSSDQLLYNGSVVASVGGGVVTSLTATANQTTVSAATGAVTVGTVQDIATTSSPTFASLTLSSPLSVPNGGTGGASHTAYALLCGGTTSTGPIQSIVSLGAASQILVSNGGGALPTFQFAVNTVIGTAGQVLVNGTSGSSQTGTITLTTPQSITTTSSPTFNNLTLSSLNTSFFGVGRNRVLNGQMRFDQKNEGVIYSSADHLAHYNLDQWRSEGTGAAEFNVSRSSAGPNNVFPYFMQIQTTVAAAPAASDGVNMEYPMDPVYQTDWAWGTANAVPVTLQFWALCSKTGTFSISFLSGTNDVSYVSTYTIANANTWQHFVVNVPGPTTGTWPTGGQVFGLKIVWDLGSGSAVTTSTLNAWQAGSVWKATGSTNLVSPGLDTLDLTGVQIEIGSTATAFEYIQYDLELALLQKYQYKTFPQGTRCLSGQGYAGALGYVAQVASTTAGGGVNLSLPVSMLATPTVSYFNPITGGANFKWYNQTLGADSGTAASGINVSSTNILALNPQVAGDNVSNKLYVQLLAQALLGGP